ncbi:MAG: hypothetical protein RIC15_03525 [Vicingaceae bacterium]
MNKVIISGLAVSLSFGCSQKADETIYMVSGIVYEDCTQKPLSGIQLYMRSNIHVNLGGQVKGGEILTNAATDANGIFVFSYKRSDGEDLSIRVSSGANTDILIDRVPINRNIENLVLFEAASYVSYLYIDFDQPYTDQDTFFWLDSQVSSYIPIVGPFADQIIDTLLGSVSTLNYYGNPSTLGYYFNNPGDAQTASYQIKLCDTTHATIKVKKP